MPDADGDEPEDDAGLPSAPHSASFGSPGSIGELRIQAATAAALLHMAIDVHGPAAGVDAARADAAAAEAALDAALARSGAPPVRLLPQSIRPIFKAPPPEAFAPPRAAGASLLAAGAAASSSGPAEVPASRVGMLPTPPTPLLALRRARGTPLPFLCWSPRVFLLPAGPPWAAKVARRASPGLAGASSSRPSPRPTLGPPSMGEALPPRATPGTPILPAPTFECRWGRARMLPSLGLPWSPE